MFKDDTYLEAVMARYKLGLDRTHAMLQLGQPISLQPSWLDRFLFSLGKILISIGSRLQHRYIIGAQETYHPAFPVG